jgi:hypothetical protein
VELSIENSGREFFDHWVRLGRSTFRLERLPQGRTRIVHATKYWPRLRPRWYWAPVENQLAQVVQAYLLEAYAKQIFSDPIAKND